MLNSFLNNKDYINGFLNNKENYIEDRLITPYIVWKHLPTQTKYVDFPFVYDNEYQKKRYYSDERPMKLEDFKKLAKGNYIKE